VVFGIKKKVKVGWTEVSNQGSRFGPTWRSRVMSPLSRLILAGTTWRFPKSKAGMSVIRDVTASGITRWGLFGGGNAFS
jgi:hypothetical protein